MDLDSLSHAQRERLAFIDFNLQYFGKVARQDLVLRFKTGLAAGTRDFTAYKTLAPDNLQLSHQDKLYYRTDDFKPLFTHDPEAVLAGLCRGFGDGISNLVTSSDVCLDAVRLIHPSAEIIAALMRAIHNGWAINCHYVSVSSGSKARVLVPHAIVNNGHRWHIRAYDRAHKQFRDFVATRFESVEVLQEQPAAKEGREFDQQWNQILQLILVPHPELANPLAVEMDYAMVDGEKTVAVRAALAGYLLRQWQVDCSYQRRITGQGCQLALANISVLSGVENMHIAPGFGH